MSRPVCRFLLGALSLAAVAAPLGHAGELNAAAIDAAAEEALRAFGVPGLAIGVVWNDRVVYLKGFGVREIGKSDRVTAETVFPIASCTKAFTSAALASLVDDGRLGWDDPVRKHVPYFRLADPLADSRATIRDLVTHRTGVGGNDLLWYRSPWDRREIIRRVGLVKPRHPFRTAFEYQTTMFVVAGCAVESAAGCPWEQFVRRRLLDPLGMQGVTFTTADAKRTPDHASPHRLGAGGHPELIPWYDITAPDPAGSINANATDLCRWLRFQLGDGTFQGHRILSAESLNETHTPQTVIRLEGQARDMNPETRQLAYGMGWVVQDYRGRLQVSHAGAIDGFRAHLTLLPNDRFGIVLLNNLHYTWMNLALSNSIVDQVFGTPTRDWNRYVAEQVAKRKEEAAEDLRLRELWRVPGTKPSHPLSAYAGEYDDPAYGTVHVSAVDGRLVWSWHDFTGPLEHYHFDTFTLRNDFLGTPLVRFSLGYDGRVSAMRLSNLDDVEFQRAQPRSAP